MFDHRLAVCLTWVDLQVSAMRLHANYARFTRMPTSQFLMLVSGIQVFHVPRAHSGEDAVVTAM